METESVQAASCCTGFS